MGTGTGGQISFVTKSGANKLHGSVFEYNRNDVFDARNYFNRASNAVNPKKFRLNQFGGSVGGPIFNDKLSGFVAYEGLRQTYVQPYTQATLSNYFRTNGSGTLPINAGIVPLLAAFPTDPTPAASETQQLRHRHRRRPEPHPGRLRHSRFDYHFNDRFQPLRPLQPRPGRFNADAGRLAQQVRPGRSSAERCLRRQPGALARFFNETKVGFNGIKMRVQGIAGPSPNADLSR